VFEVVDDEEARRFAEDRGDGVDEIALLLIGCPDDGRDRRNDSVPVGDRGATSRARLVFPIPPRPVIVTSFALDRRRSTSASSRSRPIKPPTSSRDR